MLVPIVVLWALAPLLARAGTHRQRVGGCPGRAPPSPGDPPPAPLFLPLMGTTVWETPQAWGEAGLQAGAACRQGQAGGDGSRHGAGDSPGGCLASPWPWQEPPLNPWCQQHHPHQCVPPPSPMPLQHLGSNKDPHIPLSQGLSSSVSPSRGTWGNWRGQCGKGDPTVSCVPPNLPQTSPPSPSRHPSARTPACPAAPSPGDACAGSPSPAPSRLAPTTPSPSSATAWARTHRQSQAGTHRRSPTAGLGAESPSVPWSQGMPACPCC